MHSNDGFLAKTFEKSTFHLQKTGSGQFLVSAISIIFTLPFTLPLEGTSPEGPSPGAQRAILKVYARDESYSAEGGLGWGDLTFRVSEMPFSTFSARHFQ